MTSAEDCAAAMDEVVGPRCDLLGTSEMFFKRFANGPSEIVKAAARALDYDFRPHRRSGQQQIDNPFVPMWGSAEEHFQRLKEPDGEAELERWTGLAAHVHNPAVVARLNDLLWVTKHGEQPHQHARAAIVAYLDVASQDSCTGHPALSALQRSLALTKSLNDRESGRRIAELGIAELEREQDQLNPLPDLTVVTPALRLLADLPEDHRPDDLDARIAKAHDAFGDQDILGRDVLFQIEQDLAQGDSDQIQQVRHRAVQAWMSEAKRREGWHRAHALEKAEDWAQGTQNASSLVAQARRARQEMESDIFQWAQIDASVDIPAADVERELTRVVGEDELELALLRFGSWGPPTGNPAEIQDAVDREMETTRLMHLIPETLHHSAGFEVKTFASPEEKRELGVKQHQELHARIHGTLAFEALSRIGSTYERRWGQLAGFFISDLIWPPEAHAFSRAFEHFWAGRYDEAILVALPRIESILRRTARAMGQIVFRPPDGDRPGGLKTLGEVLRLLQGKVDEGWWQSFSFVLADPLGVNLRNEYSHGLREVGTEVDAALILQLAAHLRLRTLEPTDSSAAS